MRYHHAGAQPSTVCRDGGAATRDPEADDAAKSMRADDIPHTERRPVRAVPPRVGSQQLSACEGAVVCDVLRGLGPVRPARPAGSVLDQLDVQDDLDLLANQHAAAFEPDVP